jgi:hypothetical protein
VQRMCAVFVEMKSIFGIMIMHSPICQRAAGKYKYQNIKQ